MKVHPVKLSEKEKVEWFKKQVSDRKKVANFSSKEELEEYLRFCRTTFRTIYGRDVSGSFFRILLGDFGINREQSDTIKKKRKFIFDLLDKNQAYRDSKTQLKKVVDDHFGEKLLPIVFDEIWDHYHSDTDRPAPKMNVDLFGQKPLFGN